MKPGFWRFFLRRLALYGGIYCACLVLGLGLIRLGAPPSLVVTFALVAVTGVYVALVVRVWRQWPRKCPECHRRLDTGHKMDCGRGR